MRSFIEFIVVLLLAFAFWLYLNHRESDLKSDYQSKIDSLNEQIDSLDQEIKLSEYKIRSYEDSIFVLDSLYEEEVSNVDSLKSDYEDKISDIDSYTADSLLQYFRSRY